jgi:hypothetical protein
MTVYFSPRRKPPRICYEVNSATDVQKNYLCSFGEQLEPTNTLSGQTLGLETLKQVAYTIIATP